MSSLPTNYLIKSSVNKFINIHAFLSAHRDTILAYFRCIKTVIIFIIITTITVVPVIAIIIIMLIVVIIVTIIILIIFEDNYRTLTQCHLLENYYKMSYKETLILCI